MKFNYLTYKLDNICVYIYISYYWTSYFSFLTICYFHISKILKLMCYLILKGNCLKYQFHSTTFSVYNIHIFENSPILKLKLLYYFIKSIIIFKSSEVRYKLYIYMCVFKIILYYILNKII